METNLEKAKRLLQANANISGIELPEDGFLFKMLELAATPTKLQEAAPDLFEALKSLVLSLTAHPDYTGEDNDEWTDLVEIAEAAIIRATE